MILLDLSPISGGTGVFIGVAFFLTVAGAAFVAWKLLRKTVRWAVRLTIVVLILLIAVAGSVVIMFGGSSKTSRPASRSTAR
jgi:type IV secretory pathway VirB2 component (pilin)